MSFSRRVWGQFASSWPSTSLCKPSTRSSTQLPRPTTCLLAFSPSRSCSVDPTALRPVWRLSIPSALPPGTDTVPDWRWSAPGVPRTPGAFWNQPSETTTLVSSSPDEADVQDVDVALTVMSCLFQWCFWRMSWCTACHLRCPKSLSRKTSSSLLGKQRLKDQVGLIWKKKNTH